MKNIFLALAILGTVAPITAFTPWLAEHGLDLPLFFKEMFATEVSSFFSLDVIVSALVVVTMVARGAKNGVPYAWLSIVGTFSIGVSLGLPLYLYLEARHRDAMA